MKKKAAKKKVAKKKSVKQVAASVVTTRKAKSKKKKTAKKSIGACFVLMPFKEPFDTYYSSIIEPAVTKARLRSQKGDSLFLPTPIMGDIWLMIQEAKVLVAVLTGKNANVFYELGLGHAIGKPVVLVSETMDDVPFDLQALRVILYDKNNPKWGDKLRSDITTALEATLSEPVNSVPTMFRRKVKTQAPEDSDISMRLSSLERLVASLGMEGIGEHRENWGISERQAVYMLDKFVRNKASMDYITARLMDEGVPKYWILKQLWRRGYKVKL